jgi:transcriptional repressor NrdR
VRCPYCRHADSRVVDSREAEEGQVIRRRRSCPQCGRRFTTVEEAVLAVVKRSGVSEPFSRAKVIAGVRRACQGRPVDDDALALLAQQVEETVRATGSAEIASHDVGLAILGPLRELDEVAYMRFASVYRSFSSLEDFEAEIVRLRTATRGDAADPASPDPASPGPAPRGPAQRGPAPPSTAPRATAPPAATPPNTVRPATVPPDTVPPDPVPTDTVPTDTVPTGAAGTPKPRDRAERAKPPGHAGRVDAEPLGAASRA